MGLVDENLWHRLAATAGDHFFTGPGAGVYVNLLERDALVGGCDDLFALDAAGGLDTLLQETNQ